MAPLLGTPAFAALALIGKGSVARPERFELPT